MNKDLSCSWITRIIIQKKLVILTKPMHTFNTILFQSPVKLFTNLESTILSHMKNIKISTIAKQSCTLKELHRAGEMAQLLRTLNALLKVLNSNPSNHMMAQNHP